MIDLLDHYDDDGILMTFSDERAEPGAAFVRVTLNDGVTDTWPFPLTREQVLATRDWMTRLLDESA